MQHYSCPTANSARIVSNEAANNFSFRKMQFAVLLLWENVVISQLMPYTVLDNLWL